MQHTLISRPGCYAPGTMMTAPQYRTNTGTMSGTACRAACSKLDLPWAGLTGNSRSRRYPPTLALAHRRRSTDCFCSKDKIFGAIQPIGACSWKCAGKSSKVCIVCDRVVSWLDRLAGNATEFCGAGSNYLSIYYSSGSSGTLVARDDIRMMADSGPASIDPRADQYYSPSLTSAGDDAPVGAEPDRQMRPVAEAHLPHDSVSMMAYISM